MELEDDEETAQIRWKPRVLDFVTIDGLQRITGCIPNLFPRFIVKELLDNALDKRNVHNITVRINRASNAVLIYVADDGEPTIAEQDLLKILDFSKAPSSKMGIKRVQRGVLGNALQCCFGISYALWDDDKRPKHTAFIKGEKCWNIGLKIEGNDVKPLIEPFTPNQTADVKNCTAETSPHLQNLTIGDSHSTVIGFKLPPFDYKSPVDDVKHMAILNPHVTISYADEKQVLTFEAKSNEPLSFQEDFGDVWWYSSKDFMSLARSFDNMSVESYVTHFKKFKDRRYASKILSSTAIPKYATLSSLESTALKKLFEKMRAEARPTSQRVLPIAGKATFESRGATKYVLKQGVIKTEDKHVPYALEVAAFPSDSNYPNIVECVNFTVSLYRPFTRWVYSLENGKLVTLNNIVEKAANLTILIHLVSPNLTWLNPSKGEMAELRDLEKPLLTLMKTVSKVGTVNVDDDRVVALVRIILDTYHWLLFTIRQIFYRLVAVYHFPNTRSMYNRLSKILREARELRLIDAERIVDLTRPEYYFNPQYKTQDEYTETMLKGLLNNFDLDRWGDQPYYIEVWIEKEALSRVIQPICKKYRVNLIVCKGYSSYTQIYEAAKRFPKDKRVGILYLGDHDPSGLHIQESLEERLKEELRRQNKYTRLYIKRVALTIDQVQQFKLPASPLKKASQKYKEYILKHKNRVWELDALDPAYLNNLLEESIRRLIDWNIWEKREHEIKELENKLRMELKTKFTKYFSTTEGIN